MVGSVIRTGIINQAGSIELSARCNIRTNLKIIGNDNNVLASAYCMRLTCAIVRVWVNDLNTSRKEIAGDRRRTIGFCI